MLNVRRTPALACLAACATLSAAADEASTAPTFNTDARLLIGDSNFSDEVVSLRVRAGAVWTLGPGLTAVTRAATTAWNHENDWSVGAFPGVQAPGGLAPGNVTLDLAHLQFVSRSGLKLRLGRFQETLALPAVPDKSLDRKDSDSTTVSYSDGLSAEQPIGRGWSLLGIAQYQPDEGATNRPRQPLSFLDDGSRVSGYLALRRTDETGPWALASLSYSIYPDSLPEGAEARTYTGLVGNLMRRLPAAGPGQLLVGGSVGYAPAIPQSAVTASDSRWAWQATANIVDFGPLDQGFGVVYMRAGAGWLLSPDLAAGRWLAEARYRIAPVRGLTCELRLRYRGDLVEAAGSSGSDERDWFLRFTWRSP